MNKPCQKEAKQKNIIYQPFVYQQASGQSFCDKPKKYNLSTPGLILQFKEKIIYLIFLQRNYIFQIQNTFLFLQKNTILMQAISQMNKKLVQLNSIFQQTTQNFSYSINLHESKFTIEDVHDFQKLITKIKRQVNQQIQQFFSAKIKQHSQNYQQKINKYTQNAQELHFQLFSFRNQLQRHTISLKQQQQRKQVILEHFSKRFCLNNLKKKYFQAFKINREQSIKDKLVYSQADNLYKKNLLKKVFFPWRSLTYKDGYQNNVRCQTQQDIQNIHSQYSSIINLLKSKIRDTQQVIKLKKAAKGQFAYALSKNLMKSISNLSLEVISLNQMSLQDGQFQKSKEDHKLMKQIDKLIQQKFKEVNKYKQNLVGDSSERGKQRRIKFV